MLEQLGLLGLFIGCMLAATVVPFSSDALLAGAMLAGYDRGLIILTASLGNTTGGMISYTMGWLCKWEWLEKYFRVKREKIMSVHERVAKYGVWAALVSWLPIVGDAIAIALGLLRAKPGWTLLLMFVGKTLRYIVSANLLGLTGWF